MIYAAIQHTNITFSIISYFTSWLHVDPAQIINEELHNLAKHRWPK